MQIFIEVELTEAEKDRVQDEKPNGKQAEESGIPARDNMYSFTLLNTQLIEKLENILIKMQPIEVQCKRLLFWSLAELQIASTATWICYF